MPREKSPQNNTATSALSAYIVGSIDNDMSLTDLTIGALTALHRPPAAAQLRDPLWG